MSNSKQISLTCNGENYIIPQDITLEQALSHVLPRHPLPIAALVDNVPREMSFRLRKNSHVIWLDYTGHFGSLIHKRSVTFLLYMAAQRCYPQHRLYVLHSLDKGLYCELRGEKILGEADWSILEEEMNRLVHAALPISRTEMEKWEAIHFFSENGMEHKGQLLRTSSITHVPVYRCLGYQEYLFGLMAINTSYLSAFKLYGFDQGFVLALPNPRDVGFMPSPPQEPKRMQAILKSYNDWGRLLGVDTVFGINKSIENNTYNELVLIAESMQQRMLHAICDEIFATFPTVKLLLIAGPSSSGKTTFARRLGIELRALGLKPLNISLDDYFIDRDDTPLDKEGNFDFESIEAIDLPLFNEQLAKLVHGEAIERPLYDFKTGTRMAQMRSCIMAPDNILIIEGIHALNPILTSSIPPEQKKSIYISCLTQLNLDPLVPISSSDNRQLRRMIRDFRSRNTTPEETIMRWRSVRRGENKNIFPFQENADFYFNSSLIYELPALRPLIDSHLQKIGPDSPAYPEAQRLLSLLQHFVPTQPRCIPAHSILQEFLGNSCFEE